MAPRTDRDVVGGYVLESSIQLELNANEYAITTG